ncbi:hypothetical protein BDN67DRAFT_61347 [Paxillus ammoniavirescens]|nr:hypothetical protein BDN67DRAFT_61347 [Paxillus ammoniavirescens]
MVCDRFLKHRQRPSFCDGKSLTLGTSRPNARCHRRPLVSRFPCQLTPCKLCCHSLVLGLFPFVVVLYMLAILFDLHFLASCASSLATNVSSCVDVNEQALDTQQVVCGMRSSAPCGVVKLLYCVPGANSDARNGVKVFQQRGLVRKH